jgi:hypothetical protein
MRFTPTIFGQLLEPINRRQFTAIVERHDGDAYDKVVSQLGSDELQLCLSFPGQPCAKREKVSCEA